MWKLSLKVLSGVTVNVNERAFVQKVYLPSVLWRCCLGGRKGGCGGGGAISPAGVAPTRTVSTSASIIFPCSIKIQKTGGGETQSECSTALC